MLLRRARLADAAAVAGVHVRSWQVAYRGLLPDEYLDGLRPEDRAERHTFGELDSQQPETIVAIDHGTICGFATTGPCRDDDRRGTGERAERFYRLDGWAPDGSRRVDEIWGVTVDEIRYCISLR